VQVAVAERFQVPLAIAIPEAAVVGVRGNREGELAVAAAPELVKRAARADAVVIGPGMLDAKVGAELARALASDPGEAALLVDAGALTGLDLKRPLAGREGRVVLTPHSGEMAALLGCDEERVLAHPLTTAREVAQALEAVVVMKGPDTFVVSPDGEALLHTGGVVGLATSGSGDVLAGLIGGLLAQGAAPVTAAAWGVCVHAEAGQRLTLRVGEAGFLARELLEEAPRLIVRQKGDARVGNALAPRAANL
jgi:hydroxyethylthiazole kinase-like uncharacterized protein yjeF